MALFVNAPKKRERAERFLADILTRHWSLLSEAEKREAIEAAVDFGLAFAEEWDDEPSLAAYVEMVCWWAFNSVRAINDVEFALWECMARDPESALAQDPRVLAFRIGCAHWRREHGAE